MTDELQPKDFWKLPYYTGADLERLAELCNEPRAFIIDSLIPENTATIFYADDGVGKSILLFQAVCQASCGNPVFGYYETSKPIRTLWIQAERHPRELGERYNYFLQTFKPNPNNIVITKDLQGIDLKKSENQEQAFKFIENLIMQTGNFDWIVIDPIYAIVHGDIATDDSASAITRFSTQLQTKFNLAVTMIHHTNRGGRDPMTQQRTEGDFYGNRFLLAHFSGIYKIKRNGINKLIIKCEKDSLSSLIKTVNLTYDSDTWLSTIDGENITKIEQLKNLLKQYKNSGKEFTINEINAQIHLSPSKLYIVKKGEYKNGFIFTGKLINRNRLYRSEL